MGTPANLTWLTDNLAVGGDLSFDLDEAADQVEDIVKQEIGVIIDMRVEDDDTEIWAGTDIAYVHLPTEDAHGHVLPAALFDRAVEVARMAGDSKIFVHCHMGINRGPSVAYAILLDRGYDAVAAFDLIRWKRPIAAIYYAQDALRAHGARQDWPLASQRSEHLWLQRHIDAAMDRRTVQHINRTISALHKQDQEALQREEDRG